MSTSFRILFPLFPKHITGSFLKGYLKSIDKNCVSIYITTLFKNETGLNENIDIDDTIIYGYYTAAPALRRQLKRSPNYIILNHQVHPQVQRLVLGGKEVNVKDCIIIFYDHYTVYSSETISKSNDYIYKLQSLMQKDNNELCSNISYKPSYEIPSFLSSCMLVQHMYNYINLINWFKVSIKRDKKVSIKEGNFILSIIVDIILGYFILGLITWDKKDVAVFLMGILEKLVNLMYSLLKWLMGQPAGLKLNNAFNKMLGKYFSYHIELWWLFLDVSGEKLDIVLHLYQYIGYLGFTFQAAIVADMINIATFHSYCIYVYAARLFNIQISGLIALLRLFVGKKYNPLREGIDSCEYTNQELFVGTVAFTILLLLLPTTLMYYIVFTVFRVLSLLVQDMLAKCIYLVQTVPLYVTMLWLTSSTKVAGNVLIEEIKSEKASPLLLRLKLSRKSICELVNKFRPPVEMSKQVEWTLIISSVVTGKHII